MSKTETVAVERTGPETIAVTVYLDVGELRRQSDYVAAAILHAVAGPILELEQAVRHELNMPSLES